MGLNFLFGGVINAKSVLPDDVVVDENFPEGVVSDNSKLLLELLVVCVFFAVFLLLFNVSLKSIAVAVVVVVIEVFIGLVVNDKDDCGKGLVLG